MLSWSDLLRQHRSQRGWSQRQLATAAGVAEETIASYESRKRTPSRRTLLRVSRALDLPIDATNALLTAARFEPRLTGPLAWLAAQRVPFEQMQRDVETYAWPCLVLNGYHEIVLWNEPATWVAELDFARELPLPYQRNLLRVAAMPHIRE